MDLGAVLVDVVAFCLSRHCSGLVTAIWMFDAAGVNRLHHVLGARSPLDQGMIAILSDLFPSYCNRPVGSGLEGIQNQVSVNSAFNLTLPRMSSLAPLATQTLRGLIVYVLPIVDNNIWQTQLTSQYEASRHWQYTMIITHPKTQRLNWQSLQPCSRLFGQRSGYNIIGGG